MAESLRAAITGVGAAVPATKLTNADFEKTLDTSDEWIVQRTGIRERRIINDGESTLTLAIEAARQALADADVKAKDLDLIICATITPEMPVPATSCFLQQALGVSNTPAFDLAAACSGFIYALSVGDQFIRTGMYERILIVGVDVMSNISDYSDRSSCILFGDAAGAVVLEASSDPNRGVDHTVLHAEGSGWDLIYLPGGGTRLPISEQVLADRQHYIQLQGREVYRFAVEKMQWLLGECMSKCNLTADDVDMVIPHQVNTRIINSAIEKHNFPKDKVYVNIDKYGNTCSASVPLALQEAIAEGKIGPGSTVVLVAFGAGLTWAGAVLRL
ncbi:MAG: beta-ketoacyl-ACP synthase III [Planctomycetota bacterium]|jgi:3-oxoacyl-[acyl-carrier-protein] synthase-3